MGFNFADAFEAISDALPDADALGHGEAVTSWREFDDRAARLAAAFGAAGVSYDDKVALFAYNGPEYSEAQYATFKCRGVPCNFNYRYLADELTYLLVNSDAKVIVFDHTLADRVLEVRDNCPDLRLLVQVGGDEVVAGAVAYEDLIASNDPAPRIERSPDDLWFLYTGGTTGHPKAVMWPQGELAGTMFQYYGMLDRPVPDDAAGAAECAVEFHERRRSTRLLAGAPLMHGTSGISALHTLSMGGMVVTMQGRSFDADEMFHLVEQHRVGKITIVGDVFAKPMLAALEAAEATGRPYDLSSLFQLASSGVMWSAECKQAILGYHRMMLLDTLGSSEGVGFAAQVTKAGEKPKATARFSLGEHAAVIAEDNTMVEPGSGVIGRLALGGPLPIGYYKDPEKSDEAFPVIAGRRWSVPGDFATVEPDGTITLLGRGSACINSGGEKIYPEEVEEALKSHDAVVDCNVVGLPDERWGQAVTAVVALDPRSSVTDDELIGHTRTKIAAYKAPKTIVRVDDFVRSPNGKSDYRWAASVAAESVG